MRFDDCNNEWEAVLVLLLVAFIVASSVFSERSKKYRSLYNDHEADPDFMNTCKRRYTQADLGKFISYIAILIAVVMLILRVFRCLFYGFSF